MRHRLDEQSDEVHVRDGIARDLHHVVAQTAARLVKARSVEQDELRIALGHDAVDAVARGLRLIGDNGDLLADECVGQAGLADVRTSAEGDHGGFCLCIGDPQLSFMLNNSCLCVAAAAAYQAFSVSYRSRSSRFMMASSCSRICAFMGPSSR